MDVVFEEISPSGLDQKQVDEIVKQLEKAKGGTYTVARGTGKEMDALKAALRQGGQYSGRKDVTKRSVDINSDSYELRVVKRDNGQGAPAQSESDNAGSSF